MVSGQDAAISGDNDATGLTNGTSEAGPEQSSKLVKKLYAIANERGGTSWVDECPDFLQSNKEYHEDGEAIGY
ncbi:hypothetical protein CLAFUW4_05009 [Fulvia fulva]|uniref:Uncharacterized protein n=1 Tax=Passalora fulva TaxID=5499 RepID=A0A9Q8PIN9_PASFU|nr:uncharacterized protein CLAFUR5_11898 [Fulvia fulva]KAK4626995.1 hypothetical protein CLAFUR4_04995 [Fulvia fulva]KAK4628386.1 hypothetical protein CLAFUR0_04999 [Fulvia fulva]UJO23090.1 hypothetical protein CLAFUR5_11898 [Fulvia fulva]WPV13770.1 hypothetical protein CLAFUW4_05009 [Fulvia fulva]WPV29106.1 hypothetical protein CLAFUW7_05003 [Fulvia fulva]